MLGYIQLAVRFTVYNSLPLVVSLKQPSEQALRLHVVAKATSVVVEVLCRLLTSSLASSSSITFDIDIHLTSFNHYPSLTTLSAGRLRHR